MERRYGRSKCVTQFQTIQLQRYTLVVTYRAASRLYHQGGGRRRGPGQGYIIPEWGAAAQEWEGAYNSNSLPAQCLGKVGTVRSILPSGDIRIACKGREWIFNPLCLSPRLGKPPKEEERKLRVRYNVV